MKSHQHYTHPVNLPYSNNNKKEGINLYLA